VRVRFEHVADFIVNANHCIVLTAAMHRVADCIPDCVPLAVPQATKWQRIGNQIDAATIFARADFVKVQGNAKRLASNDLRSKNARRTSAIQSKNCV
jgi:hypothetical protein